MVVAASPRVYIRRCPHSDFSLLPLEGGAPKGRRLALGFLPSNIHGGQPRLAPLGSPFQRKGLEWGMPFSAYRHFERSREILLADR